MDAGPFFLCSCCGTQFPSALQLSQHCATHHQIFELSPFISVGSILPTGLGAIPQVQPAHLYEPIEQHPTTRKSSGHDFTLTQLQTVNTSSQGYPVASSTHHWQPGEDTHRKSDKLPVLSTNLPEELGSECSARSGATQSTIPIALNQCQEREEAQSKIKYTLANLTPTSEAHVKWASSFSSDKDGNHSMQTVSQVESQLYSIGNKTPTTTNEARMMQTHIGGPTAAPGTFSVIQSNRCGPTGQKDHTEKESSRLQKPILSSVSVVSTFTKDTEGGSMNHPGSLLRLCSSTVPVLPLHMQQSFLPTHTFPMSVMTAVGVTQTESVFKPSKPSRGQGPRPFSCPTCLKTFTLKCNLQQHEIYAHSDDRPYACSKCDRSFKLKGHLKEHEHNAHSEERPFKCSQCEKTFKQKSHLKGHMSIHDGAKPHRCETCGLVFRQKQHLKRHVLTHTGKRLFSCPHCPSTFNISSDLKRHNRIHTGERPFHCTHCGKGFARKQAVRIHERIHQKPFTCQRCNKSFRDLQALSEHEKKHVKTLSHDCRECDQRFSLFMELKDHMKIHRGKNMVAKKRKTTMQKGPSARPTLRMTRQRAAAASDAAYRKIKAKPSRSAKIVQAPTDEMLSCHVCHRRFQKQCYVLRHELKCHGIQHHLYHCKECGETFTGRNAFMTHAREHKDPERFRCDQCSSGFRYKSQLHRHLDTAHGVKPFSCKVCSKTFTLKKSFLEHSKTCTKENTLTCELCKDVFKRMVSLLRHKVRVHGLRPYTCSICERGFANKGTLERHTVTHSSDRPHQCQYCSKTFKEKRQVDQHEKVHRGERPFQCFQCGLSFHRMAYLERHEAIHTGEKRFQCPHCPTAFYMGHDLKRHLRIHTGEKPFTCKICRKSFRRKAAVVYHEKQVHMRKFQCSYCSRKFFTKTELDGHTVIHLGTLPPPPIPPPLQTQQDKSDEANHLTRESGEVAPALVGLHVNVEGEHLVSNLAPSSDTGAIQITGFSRIDVTNTSHGSHDGSDTCNTPHQPSDIPPSQSEKSVPDSSQTSAHSAPSDGSDVTFFLCNSCGILFPSALMLARHTQLLHNPSITINSPADKQDPTKRRDKNNRSKGKQKGKFEVMGDARKHQICAECGEEYTSDLKAHVHECLDPSSIPISPGPEVVEEPGSDYEDQDPVGTDGPHTEKDASLYYCGECGKGFKKISSRNVHQRIHTGDKPFVCKTCNKAFSVRSNLKQHEIAKHTDERPYNCTKCSARFKQRSHLKSHEQIHEGIKKYECPICNQKFRQPSHLQRHKLVHDGIKQYKCEHCPSAFNLASDLQRHSLIHAGVKPFPCDQCEKRFRRKFQLKVHRQTHSGELPLQCPHCRKAFLDKKCFESHVSAHEGKTLHNCDACGKSFSTDYVLKRHSCKQKSAGCLRCEQCAKSFKRKDSLDKHRCRRRITDS
nr:zinc finger protein 850-like [Lytechinus pictus]